MLCSDLYLCVYSYGGRLPYNYGFIDSNTFSFGILLAYASAFSTKQFLLLYIIKDFLRIIRVAQCNRLRKLCLYSLNTNHVTYHIPVPFTFHEFSSFSRLKRELWSLVRSQLGACLSTMSVSRRSRREMRSLDTELPEVTYVFCGKELTVNLLLFKQTQIMFTQLAFIFC